jgi:DNA polymerase-1
MKYKVADKISEFEKYETLALDFETVSFTDLSIELFSLAAKNRKGEIIAGSFEPSEFPKLKKLLKGRKVIFHNFSFDGKVYVTNGGDVFAFDIEDTILMAALLFDVESKGLKERALADLKFKMAEYESVNKKNMKAFKKYSTEDAVATIALYDIYRERIKKEELVLAYQVEKKFTYALMFMEYNGVKVDYERAAKLKAQTHDRFKALEKKTHVKAGYVFSLDSTQQLGEYLFEDLEIPMKNTYLTQKGARSTSASVLEDILLSLTKKDPRRKTVEEILEYRKMKKLHSTFFDAMIDNAKAWGDDRVRPHINQVSVVTGRLSMSGPNLQQLPANPIVEGDMDTHIRSILVADKGKLLVAADYSQIELRVMAHYSEDVNMLKGYMSGMDYHTYSANLLGVDRKLAKVVNFGILYGLGIYGVSVQAGISMDQAKKFMALYYRTFSGIPKLRKRVLETVLANGYIRTLGGRKRRLVGDIRDWDEGSIERLFMSHLIQGGAAVVMKLGAIRCFNRWRNQDVKMLLSVHDELVFEIPEKGFKPTVKHIKYEMENATELKVPLVAEVKYGKRYSDCK